MGHQEGQGPSMEYLRRDKVTSDHDDSFFSERQNK